MRSRGALRGGGLLGKAGGLAAAHTPGLPLLLLEILPHLARARLLGAEVDAHKPVAGLVLLEVLDAVVDETEARGASAAEHGLEAVDDDSVHVSLVELGDVLAELLLGDGLASGVDDIHDLKREAQRAEDEDEQKNGERQAREDWEDRREHDGAGEPCSLRPMRQLVRPHGSSFPAARQVHQATSAPQQ